MLYSNYNVLVLSIKADGIYKIGDTYKSTSHKDGKFDGLVIQNIDYCFGVRLHFNYYDWFNNRPPIKEIDVCKNRLNLKKFI